MLNEKIDGNIFVLIEEKIEKFTEKDLNKTINKFLKSFMEKIPYIICENMSKMYKTIKK